MLAPGASGPSGPAEVRRKPRRLPGGGLLAVCCAACCATSGSSGLRPPARSPATRLAPSELQPALHRLPPPGGSPPRRAHVAGPMLRQAHAGSAAPWTTTNIVGLRPLGFHAVALRRSKARLAQCRARGVHRPGAGARCDGTSGWRRFRFRPERLPLLGSGAAGLRRLGLPGGRPKVPSLRHRLLVHLCGVPSPRCGLPFRRARGPVPASWSRPTLRSSPSSFQRGAVMRLQSDRTLAATEQPCWLLRAVQSAERTRRTQCGKTPSPRPRAQPAPAEPPSGSSS